MRLRNKLAMITGGATGIGKSIVELFAREGAGVFSIDTVREAGESAARELRNNGHDVRYVPVDWQRADDLARVFQMVEREYDYLDVIINTAEEVICRGIIDATIGDLEKCLSVTLQSAWQVVRRAVPLLQKRGGGSVVNLSSMHAYRTLIGSFPYSMVETALIGLTRSMAVDLGQHGIRVNAICRGIVETEESSAWIEELKLAGEWKRLMNTHPLGRPGTPDEIAKVALFLASDESSFITGTHLFVDGGHHAVKWNFPD